MSSFRALLGILGVTIFAGAAGLYALEEYADRSAKKEKKETPETQMESIEEVEVDQGPEIKAPAPKKTVLFEFHDSSSDEGEEVGKEE